MNLDDGEFAEAFNRILNANDNSMMSLLISSGINPEIDLVGVDFAESSFEEEKIERFNFTLSDLRRSNFSGANIIRCKFDESDLRESDFSRAKIENTTFLSAKLFGARFEPEHLSLLSSEQIREINVVDPVKSAAEFDDIVTAVDDKNPVADIDRLSPNIFRREFLVRAVMDRTGRNKADSTKLVNAILASIVHSLKKGDEVRIRNFGLFYVRKYRAKSGINPRTGEQMTVKRAHMPKFRAEKCLLDSLNQI